MKILVLSLLRIGDVIMAAPAIRALKNKYPDARIELLVNDSSVQGARLLKDVDEVHIFPRLMLQASMADAQSPIFQAPQHLYTIMNRWVERDYELVVNLTHNRLSGYLAGFFPAEKTLGLHLNADGVARFGSPWLAYLDRQALERGKMMVHYSDIFRESCGGGSWNQDYFVESGHDLRSRVAARWPKLASRRVVIQAQTSDEKKNWPMSSWLEAIMRVHGELGDVEFIALASPSEEAVVSPLVVEARAQGVPLRMAVTTLAEALEILRSCELVVSLDTSVKHLAMSVKCPLIELAIGSSDPYRTGAYRPQTFVLQSRLSCAPCVHSMPCGESSHLCADSLSGDWVGMIAGAVLQGDLDRLYVLSEAAPRAQIQYADWTEFGLWQMVPICREPNLKWLGQSLNLLAQCVGLRRERGELVSSEGTAAYQWLRWLRRSFAGAQPSFWRHALGELQAQSDELGHEVADARRRLAQYIESERRSDVPQLQGLREIRERVIDLSDLTEVKEKILRAAYEWKEETYL